MKGAMLCGGADITEVGTVVRVATRKSGFLTASCVTLVSCVISLCASQALAQGRCEG